MSSIYAIIIVTAFMGLNCADVEMVLYQSFRLTVCSETSKTPLKRCPHFKGSFVYDLLCIIAKIVNSLKCSLIVIEVSLYSPFGHEQHSTNLANFNTP